MFNASGAAVTDTFWSIPGRSAMKRGPMWQRSATAIFVVVWTTDNDLTATSRRVFMQLPTRGRRACGELVTARTTPSSGDAFAHVTALDAGGFVVAWESDDGWGRGYFIQQYDAAGHQVDGAPARLQSTTSDRVYGV